MPETYVVTGGAGFIGSHIAERLLHDGHTVRVVDNFLTGKRPNIQHLLDHDRFTLYAISITDPEALKPVFAGADYVLHQAALASVPLSVADPLETHRHCLTGTLSVLKAAHDAGIKRVVYASSSAVYGDTLAESRLETMPPQPISPYGAAKLAGEYYCEVFTKTYGMETVSLRYFNVFGPRQDPNSDYAPVIPRFITRMMDGRPPIIYGDGLQSRDFAYVDNVVAGNLLAAKAPGAAGKVLNLSTGDRVTLLELVAMLNRLLGTDYAPQHEPARPGDIKESRANIEAARQALNYQPSVSFEEGLAQTVRWFEDVRNRGART